MTENKQLSKRTHAFRLQVNDGVAWLSINVPNSSMNTLQASFIDEITELLDWLEQQSDVQGLVIYSAKPNSFVAGADVGMIDEIKTEPEALALSLKGQQICSRIENLPLHVVAAIHGVCLGGGLELSLACHSRIATDENITKLGLPEVKLGLLPGMGGTQRLPRLIGTLRALDLILTGKALNADKAKKLGLVDDVVPKSILFDVANELALTAKPHRKTRVANWLLSHNPLCRWFIFNAAKKKAQQKTRGNYPAVDEILQVIEYGLKEGAEAGFALEAERFAKLVMTRASSALRHLFFISTEVKKQQSRDAKPQQINAVAVLGGGLMGSGIAFVSAVQAKAQVQVKDLSNESLAKTLQYSYALLQKKRQRKQLSIPKLHKQMSAITVTTHYANMAPADFVIEAVFEDLTTKQQVLNEVEAHFSDQTIFASNTSSIPIAQIAQTALRPENVIGLHYFSPVEKMPLVEVIPHQGTSEQTIAATVKFAKAQGKTPIIVADIAGFYVNRILAAYLNEAARILVEGETVDVIDAALEDFGFPLGPFSLLDEVGIDVCAKVSPVLHNALGARFNVPALFSTLLLENRLGKKTKQGFYRYKGKKKSDNNLYRLLGIKPNPCLNAQEIALRCILAMLNECARCIDDKIIYSAKDGDLGAVFGFGFPPFLGGPFCYMDALGIAKTVKLMKKFERRYGECFAPCELLVKMMNEKISFYKSAVNENSN